jgi:hypothetical protein
MVMKRANSSFSGTTKSLRRFFAPELDKHGYHELYKKKDNRGNFELALFC